jgi:hypothetical protein
MSINHWLQAYNAAQQRGTSTEHATYRELDPEEMTQVSGGVSLTGEHVELGGHIPAAGGTD